MKRGYKETEIGEIPEEWEVASLGYVSHSCDYGIGASAVSWSPELPRYLRITDIDETGNIIPQNQVSLDDTDYKSSVLNEGDLLFARTGNTVGKSYLFKKADFCEKEVVYAGYLIRFVPNRAITIPTFIFQFTQSRAYKKWVTDKKRIGAQPNINAEEYSSMRFPLPPLPEQKKIAEVLLSVDESIRATQAVIEQAKVLKQGMLNQLLTKGIGHKKFKQTEIGEIPVEWEVVELRSCGDWKGGGTPSKNEPAYWENGTIHWVSSFEVKEQYLQNTTYKITEKAIAETSATLVPKGSLLMVMRSGILAHTFPVSMTIFPLAINQDVKALIPNSDFDSLYLLSVLESRSSIILKDCVKSGTTVQSVEFDWLKSLFIPKPSLSEQQEIGRKIKHLDDSITFNRTLLEQYASVKSGLMQDLLSGKKRVV